MQKRFTNYGSDPELAFRLEMHVRNFVEDILSHAYNMKIDFETSKELWGKNYRTDFELLQEIKGRRKTIYTIEVKKSLSSKSEVEKALH